MRTTSRIRALEQDEKRLTRMIKEHKAQGYNMVAEWIERDLEQVRDLLRIDRARLERELT